ncbi:SLAM family member 5-like isoform X3 [Zootoca vivipara]|uniref:SLAM family member 5-like isoform X3 n=1 Tax=Zootoca vivipara TaxID=8524 RepID=UPI00293B949F|nr:SLAM family member 5-like isoform X3 [Zootoca vivipara]
MMLRRAFFILGLLGLPAGSSREENAVNMKGILGGSATFLLNTSEQFKKITWLRTKGKQDVEIFVATRPRKDPEERCELHVEIPAYRGRLSVSEDCKRLQINNLSQEDSGIYTAQIWIADDKDPISETFPLRVYSSSGEENAVNMKGILGGSASFLLNTSEQFKKISWLRTKRKDVEIFVVARPQKDPEERCELHVEIQAYKGRLSVSEDCKTLEINNLSQEDSGKYTAQITVAEDKEPIRETFPLRVYKRLLEADLEIVCERKDYLGGNGTLQLNCSAGSWEEDATISWAPASMSESIGGSLVTWHNLEGNDLNFTCIVENPVSEASKTVSFLEICSEHQATTPGMWPPTQTEDGPRGSKALYILAILAVVVVIICAGLFVWWKKKREPKECHTVYSQIENFPQNSPSEPQQQRGPKAKKAGPQTIYTTVHLPKQNPLQTDDEKMRRTREKSEKTIYSEITKPQECEDQDSKTVYDTVNNPRPPETTEYDKIL